MKLKGKIQRILPMQCGKSQKGNEWQKVEFIIEEAGREHPDTLCISAMNDRVQEFIDIKEGDLVEVEFDCRCNEYNGRVYNSITMFRIAKFITQQQTPQQGHTQPPMQPTGPGDNLPF